MSPYVYPILKHDLMCRKKYPYIKNYSRLKKETVIELVAKEFDVLDDFVTIKTRKRTYVEPRKLLCYIFVKYMHMSKMNIAREIVGYDHSVVIYSYRTFVNLYGSDDVFKSKCDNVLRKLYLI
jgi:chromosomal replication initiation ATPase DnaA